MRRAEMIVALDVDEAGKVEEIVRSLPERVRWYKVGLELYCKYGPEILGFLKQARKKIFLDLKLHDIPNTVERAVRSLVGLQVEMLTVHAAGGAAMLAAAVRGAEAAGSGAPRVIAVTMLTSLGQADAESIGFERPVAEQSLRLASLAMESGCAGLVSSVHEVPLLREKLGEKPLLVTPGIRLAGGAVGDQRRVATPRLAVESGSDFLVVGRAILDAADRGVVAESILAEMGG